MERLSSTVTPYLSIPKFAIKTDEEQPKFVAKLILSQLKKKDKVGILGLAYKSDLKVHTLSPALAIIKYLKSKKVEVEVHDPYYTPEEVMYQLT